MAANTLFGRAKELFDQIHKLEDRLEKANFLPMREQQAIHKQIAELKAEVTRLERLKK